MHLLLADMAHRFDRLRRREDILEAISDLENAYDALSEIEQDTESAPIDEPNRRLRPAEG